MGAKNARLRWAYVGRSECACVRRVYARGLERFEIEIEGTGSQGEYLLPGGRYSQRSWGAVWRMYLALLRRPWPLHFHAYGAGAAGRRETPVAVYTSRAAVDIENKPRKFVATERRRRRATRWRNVCGQCHARRLEREPHRPSRRASRTRSDKLRYHIR